MAWLGSLSVALRVKETLRDMAERICARVTIANNVT